MDRFLDFFFDHIGDLLLTLALSFVFLMVFGSTVFLRDQDDEEEK